jgi:hypothetical protein
MVWDTRYDENNKRDSVYDTSEGETPKFNFSTLGELGAIFELINDDNLINGIKATIDNLGPEIYNLVSKMLIAHAGLLGDYRKELMGNGFTREESMDIILNMQMALRQLDKSFRQK